MKVTELTTQEPAFTPDADMLDAPALLNVNETLEVAGSPEVENDPPPG